MFFTFLDELRAAGIPASLKEHLLLLEALDAEVIERTPLGRIVLASLDPRASRRRSGRPRPKFPPSGCAPSPRST